MGARVLINGTWYKSSISFQSWWSHAPYKNCIRDFAGRWATSVRRVSGNVAITFVALCVPRHRRGWRRRRITAAPIRSGRRWQGALNSTALTLAKNAGTLTAAQLQSQGAKYFKAVFTRTDAENPKVVVTSNAGTATIKVDGTTNMDTTLLSIVGIKKVKITADATAAWSAQTRLRVALVLDNTGSMANSGKMPALQQAAKNMLAKLASSATNNGDVYVSIVPFVKDVNLGSGNYNSSWLDWTDWDENKGKCSNSSYTTKSSCESHFKTWTPTSHSSWNGCVVDRGDAGGPNPSGYDANAVLRRRPPSKRRSTFPSSIRPVRKPPWGRATTGRR